MYSILLASHSLVRWILLAFLLLSIIRALNGWFRSRQFSRTDNLLRHWTATIAHIQLLLGISLYIISPIVAYFLNNYHKAVHIRELRFFGMEHNIMMLVAIIILTIGSMKTKRQVTDHRKFRTMAIWFSVTLIVLLIMIPWPFSPLSPRPYFRPF